MRHENTEVAVLGAGAAGATIGYELARRGVQVTILDRGGGIGSTWTNQKWKHSGLLYQLNPDLAHQLWDAYVHMHPIERQYVLKKNAYFLVHREETLAERDAIWCNWAIPFERLAPSALSISSKLGKSQAVGGFRTPDSVIDFPALLPDLCIEAQRLGVRIVTDVMIKQLVREGDEVIGAVYEKNREEILLHCHYCVMALGSWAPEVLRKASIYLPVNRWKCHVLTIEGEVVERITVFLDDPFVTLVPYQGHTLIADKRRMLARDGDDRTPAPEQEKALKTDLAACFPSLPVRMLKLAKVYACIKTEVDLSEIGIRNQNMAIFDDKFHHVRRLIVVFPGKASLMFTLARKVATHVMGELSSQLVFQV